MEIVFATNNAHKLSEVRAILGSRFHILSLEEVGCNHEIPETADTFEGNALIKARHVFEETGLPCLSDDSGLEVFALDMAPGVFSARYAGLPVSHERNNLKLLSALKNVTDRRARFRTVICHLPDHATPLYFNGTLNGIITENLKGEGGFGYDPLFIPEGYQHTFAELHADVKNAISHRANAVKEWLQYISSR